MEENPESLRSCDAIWAEGPRHTGRKVGSLGTGSPTWTFKTIEVEYFSFPTIESLTILLSYDHTFTTHLGLLIGPYQISRSCAATCDKFKRICLGQVEAGFRTLSISNWSQRSRDSLYIVQEQFQFKEERRFRYSPHVLPKTSFFFFFFYFYFYFFFYFYFYFYSYFYLFLRSTEYRLLEIDLATTI